MPSAFLGRGADSRPASGTGYFGGNYDSLKETYILRDGLMHSDQATIPTGWRRMGNYLQANSILYDPVYMSEPYSTMMWVSDTTLHG